MLKHTLGASGSFSFGWESKEPDKKKEKTEEEKAKEGIRNNWGAEIDFTIGFPFASTKAETIALAALDAGDKLVTKIQDKMAQKDLGEKTKKKEVAGAAADTTRKGWMAARGLAKKSLSEELLRVGGSQSLVVAIIFGMDSGKFQYRIELRDVISASTTIGLGKTGLSVGYEKSTRRRLILGETDQ